MDRQSAFKIGQRFFKKLLTGIFGCPKLHFGQKKRKNFIFFSLFIRGTLMIFQEDFLRDFFRKVIRKMKKEFLSKMQLGTSKNACQKFFEESLNNFECALSVCPKSLTTSPFLSCFAKMTFPIFILPSMHCIIAMSSDFNPRPLLHRLIIYIFYNNKCLYSLSDKMEVKVLLEVTFSFF